jgi:hypothetical protein
VDGNAGASGVAAPELERVRLQRIDVSDVDPQTAAQEAVDPDRLLEGEDPDTRYPEDARRWIEVYTELATFKDRALATAHESLANMPQADARQEALRTDFSVLEAERERLRRRLEYWKQRHVDLSMSTPSPPQPSES